MKYIDADLLRKEVEKRMHICNGIFERDSDIYFQGKAIAYKETLSFLSTLESGSSETPKEDTLRYCIEYINPCFPLLDSGNLNVRYLRVPDEHWAEMAITLILSFGGKIYSLYRGNVKDGKLADWPTPMIVESEDWFTDEWLHELMDCGHNCL